MLVNITPTFLTVSRKIFKDKHAQNRDASGITVSNNIAASSGNITNDNISNVRKKSSFNANNTNITSINNKAHSINDNNNDNTKNLNINSIPICNNSFIPVKSDEELDYRTLNKN